MCFIFARTLQGMRDRFLARIPIPLPPRRAISYQGDLEAEAGMKIKNMPSPCQRFLECVSKEYVGKLCKLWKSAFAKRFAATADLSAIAEFWRRRKEKVPAMVKPPTAGTFQLVGTTVLCIPSLGNAITKKKTRRRDKSAMAGK